MSHLDKLEQNWSNIARSGEAAKHIRPSQSEEEYWESGAITARMFLELLPDMSDKVVLEFGCGNGRITKELAKYIHLIYAVDISMDMLDAVEALNLANVITHHSDCTTHDGRITTVDAIVTQCVLFHNIKADIAKILTQFGRLICPNGSIIIDQPIFEESAETETHIGITTLTPAEFVSMLEAANLYHVGPLPVNPGKFSYENFGPNYSKLIVLKRKR